MKLAVLITVLLCLSVWAAEQHATAHFDGHCLSLSEHAWAEAPYVNGEPDWEHVKVHGLKINRKCGTIEVKK